MPNQAILCVDDEKVILLALIQELKKGFGSQYLYEKAVNADDALLIIEDLAAEGVKVILIISDWLMPGIKGDEFLELVRERHPGIKAIMITGHADAAAIERVRKNSSVFGILKKPWENSELLGLISQTCED